MTVKELREAISNLPDDGEVYIQRIEDKYFEGKGAWSVKLMEGEEYHRALSRMKNFNITMLDSIAELKEQYIDTHCCINYDGKNLYISSHY